MLEIEGAFIVVTIEITNVSSLSDLLVGYRGLGQISGLRTLKRRKTQCFLKTPSSKLAHYMGFDGLSQPRPGVIFSHGTQGI